MEQSAEYQGHHKPQIGPAAAEYLLAVGSLSARLKAQQDILNTIISSGYESYGGQDTEAKQQIESLSVAIEGTVNAAIEQAIPYAEEVEAPLPTVKEADLITGAKAGNNQDFADLYVLYSPKLNTYLCRHTDKDTAADILQETFVRAFKNLSMYEQRGISISAWLTTISRNLLMDHYRKVSRRRETTDDAIEFIPARDDTARTVIGRMAIENVLLSLAPYQRETITAVFINGEKESDYARRVGISVFTVRTRIHRAREVLHKLREAEQLAV